MVVYSAPPSPWHSQHPTEPSPPPAPAQKALAQSAASPAPPTAYRQVYLQRSTNESARSVRRTAKTEDGGRFLAPVACCGLLTVPADGWLPATPWTSVSATYVSPSVTSHHRRPSPLTPPSPIISPSPVRRKCSSPVSQPTRPRHPAQQQRRRCALCAALPHAHLPQGGAPQGGAPQPARPRPRLPSCSQCPETPSPQSLCVTAVISGPCDLNLRGPEHP